MGTKKNDDGCIKQDKGLRQMNKFLALNFLRITPAICEESFIFIIK